MSTQKIPQQSLQITTTGAKSIPTPNTNEGDSVDIEKIIISNSSASNVLVTISDGVNNYYYATKAGDTVIDSGGLEADVTSTGWTAQIAAPVSSVYISVVFD